jgi:hypothetical protein
MRTRMSALQRQGFAQMLSGRLADRSLDRTGSDGSLGRNYARLEVSPAAPTVPLLKSTARA